jgi:hypothetical protein
MVNVPLSISGDLSDTDVSPLSRMVEVAAADTLAREPSGLRGETCHDSHDHIAPEARDRDPAPLSGACVRSVASDCTLSPCQGQRLREKQSERAHSTLTLARE